MQEMKNKALMNDDIQIKINHVGMTFKDNQGNDVQALKDVNLDIKKGEFPCLVRPDVEKPHCSALLQICRSRPPELSESMA